MFGEERGREFALGLNSRNERLWNGG